MEMNKFTEAEQWVLDGISAKIVDGREGRLQKVAEIMEHIEMAHPLVQQMAEATIRHYLSTRSTDRPFDARQSFVDGEVRGNVPGMLLAFGDLYTSLYETGDYIGWSEFKRCADMLRVNNPFKLAQKAVDRLYIQTVLRNPSYPQDVTYRRNLLPRSMQMRHSICEGEFPSQSALFHYEVVEDYLDYIRSTKRLDPNLPDAVICLTRTDDPDLLKRVTRHRERLLLGL